MISGVVPRAGSRLVGLLIVALLATGLGFTAAPSAGATPVRPTGTRAFSSLYSTNTTGNILLRGNTLMTCPANSTGSGVPVAGETPLTCAQAQGPVGSGPLLYGRDNDFNMQYVNVDPAAVTAGYVDSSSARITIPGGATVLKAFLMWSGQVTGTGTGQATFSSTLNTVQLKAPGRAYVPETSAVVDSTSTSGAIAYQGVSDVTSAVQSAGSGMYTVANVQSTVGFNNYAGWSLAIAYQDPTQPDRNLNLYSGFANVNSSAGSNNVAIPVNGFTTPATGTVVTEVGVVAWEGDRGNVGDSMTVGSSSLSNTVNPVNDVFNSTMSDLGTPVTDGNPSYQNTLGTDIDTFDGTGALTNGATSTTVHVTTSAETYYPGLLTFATTLNSPSLTATKTVSDVTNNTITVGDRVNYAIAVQNTGTNGATTSVLTDAIPAGVTYVAGSLTINGAAVTDVAGDDTGEVVAGTVTARIGTGATAGAGGQLAVGASTTVAFRGIVNSAPNSTVFTNTANLTYNDATTGVAFSGASDTTTSTVGGPTLVFLAPPAGQVNVAYTDTLVASGGTAPYTWSVNAGTLPPGLTLDAATGVLSGTPTTAGTYDVTLWATDVSGYVGSEAAVITITGPGLSISTPPVGEATATYTDTLSATGGTGPYTYAVTSGSLPAGLTLSAAGVISGRPTASAVGTAVFTITVTDATTATATAETSISVVAGPVLATVPPSGELNATYSATLAATGGSGPYTYAVTTGSLPAGMTLSTSGVLTGPPTATGTTAFTVTATDANGGTATDPISLTVVAQPTLTFAAPPAGETTAPYSDQLTESGGTGPFTYTVASGLPPGITITAGGLLAGTPTAAGPYSFTVRVTDVDGKTSTRAASVTVNPGPVLTFTPPAGEVNAAYTATFAATGGSGSYTGYAVTAGALPPGLTLSAAGVLSGTPTTGPATSSFTVTVTDSAGGIAVDATSIVVVAGPVLAPASPPAEVIQTAFSYQFTASGGTTPYEWIVSAGSLPTGVNLNFGTGLLTGTPSVAGTFPFTLQVVDADGQSATRPVTLVVDPAAALTASVTSVRFGTTVTFTATLTPSTATGTVTFGDLLAGGSTVPLGSATVSNGIATLTVALPAFDLNTVTATYGGNSTLATIGSPGVAVQVNGYRGEVLVDEFRLSGPAGANDQYVELYNTGPAVPLAGFGILASSGGSVTLPNSAPTLPTGHAYLVTGGSYSLTAAAADTTRTNLGSAGIQVTVPDSASTVVDAVGSTAASPGFFTGTPLASLSGLPTNQYAWVRTEKAGAPVNTSDNAADFKLVSTTGAVVGGVQSTLGSPAPRATGSPNQSNRMLESTLLDPTQPANAAPNFVHTTTPTNYITVRRTLTNSSGSTITSMAIRITALSEANGVPEPGVTTQPTNVALLRLTDPLTSTSTINTAAGPVTVQNLSVDAPAGSSPGGGLNTTLTVPLSGGLDAGGTVSIAFTFDIDRGGTYWFAYDVDALTGSSPSVVASPVALRLNQFAIRSEIAAGLRSAPIPPGFDRNGGLGRLM